MTFLAGEHPEVLPIFDGDGKTPSLSDRYMVPPFSVLDARQGWWQTRKRQWIGIGIQSELGRFSADGGVGLTYNGIGGWIADNGYQAQRRRGAMTTTSATVNDRFTSAAVASGTSIFDPVLCELAYRWFSPPGGMVIDPFAGGSVRGVTASMLGRHYHGCDLSTAQVAANYAQKEALAGKLIGEITWSSGDSARWDLPDGSADMIFTCPPYLWLERYSDHPADLSGMTEEGFECALGFILGRCARALRNDRFAVVVIGDVRDDGGALVDARGVTVRAARTAGLRLHTAAVLLTVVGSLSVRAGKQFSSSRILGRSHQDVLVFVKGDRKRAAAACGTVETP